MKFARATTTTVFAMTLFTLPSSSFAADWSACTKEIKAHCKDSKGDEAIFACLEKLDNEKKLSKKCNAVHDKYEKDTGKEGADDEKPAK